MFINYYLEYFESVYNKTRLRLSHDIKEFFWNYSWDGNVRELKNVIESMITLSTSGQELTMDQIPTYLKEFAIKQRQVQVSQDMEFDMMFQELDTIPYYKLMDNLERKLVCEALKKAKGNKTKAAEILGLPRQTLKYRLQKLEIHDVQRNL